ncbi:MAG: epoxyqueuosine reductase [Candidatus Riflebacteria bacterium]|nr:epoxyqueuosine reductase [Candidatus Riflebacteria bacterium]
MAPKIDMVVLKTLALATLYTEDFPEREMFMSCEKDIRSELKKHDIDLVDFVDVSELPADQNKGFPNAILFGIPLSEQYIQDITRAPDYVQIKIKSKSNFDDDELNLKECKASQLADHLATYLTAQGYKAYSQSDGNLVATGFFDVVHRKAPLPHKTIASLAGWGWMGKNNLLITPEFGSALCLGTVLTDAPLKTVLHKPISPKCDNCCICVNICDVKSLKGSTWSIHSPRESMITDFHGKKPGLKY